MDVAARKLGVVTVDTSGYGEAKVSNKRNDRFGARRDGPVNDGDERKTAIEADPPSRKVAISFRFSVFVILCFILKYQRQNVRSPRRAKGADR